MPPKTPRRPSLPDLPWRRKDPATDATPAPAGPADEVALKGDDAAANGETEVDRRMIKRLDVFLDDVAAEHRDRMEEVVAWLTKSNRLDHEIQASVGALSVLFHKWSIEIGFLLRMFDNLRFNELKTHLTGIGSRTLSQRLKELEAQDIVHREVFPEVPVRVVYSLTPRGMRMADLFLPVIAHLRITSPPEA